MDNPASRTIDPRDAIAQAPVVARQALPVELVGHDEIM